MVMVSNTVTRGSFLAFWVEHAPHGVGGHPLPVPNGPAADYGAAHASDSLLAGELLPLPWIDWRYIPCGGMVFGMRGYSMNTDDLVRRLRRVEGQVRGIAQMVEDDRYCIDVLTQIAAATRALQSVAVGMLDDHLRHCVVDAAARGGDEADERISEATSAIERLIKS